MMTGLIAAGLGLAVVVVFVSLLVLVAKNYIKVSPNKVLVVYGRQYAMLDADGNKTKQRRGFKLITGGAALCIPLLEKYQLLPLEAFQFSAGVTNVPSKQNVLVTVRAVASMKISREQGMLAEAVNRFLGKELGEIEAFAKEVVDGGLRGVVAQMTVEELVQDRARFTDAVTQQVTQDLQTLGLQLDNLVVQEISDEAGYIVALGVKQTVAVKRDAAIAEADAKRDQDIQVAEALREADEKSSEARRLGETAKAKSLQQISDAERDRDQQIAKNKAKVQADQRRIDIIAETAAAEEDKNRRIATVAAEEAEVEARTKLQVKEKERRDAELQASTIITAEREAEAGVITANGVAKAEVVKAEGVKKALIEKAQGERQAAIEKAAGARKEEEEKAEARKATAAAQLVEAENKATGDKAAAVAHQAELEAEAAGVRARLEADAAGESAMLQAKAEGTRTQLLAEAEGIRQKAAAYRELPPAGILLELSNVAPDILKALGSAIKEAGEGVVAPLAQGIGEGLSAVDEIRLVQIGQNGSGNGSSDANVLQQFIKSPETAIFGFLNRLDAAKLGPLADSLLAMAGIDLGEILRAAKESTQGESLVGVASGDEKSGGAKKKAGKDE